MTFEHTDGSNQDFVTLCHELDAYLNHIAGGEENRAQYIPYNSLDDIHDAFVVYDGKQAIGCAAIKRYVWLRLWHYTEGQALKKYQTTDHISVCRNLSV